MKNRINVTQTFLPPQEEYQTILKESWSKNWMSNRGPLVKKLENKLKMFFDVENIILTSNGTLPLQIAVKTLPRKGEIITTPFSYIATTSAIVWEGYKPMFVDVHPEYLTIDETKIEEKINKDTVAILATHVFGNPCDVDAISKIAAKHNLKVIYDAAHCFGVSYKDKSIFSYGDINTCSFHATKIFHTGEGGCLISNNSLTHQKLFRAHNFGHVTPNSFDKPGINAKMSELNAAMGLAVFPHFDSIRSGRKKVVETYNEFLDFSRIHRIKIRKFADWNYSYYPIIFDSNDTLKKVIEVLNSNNIFPRRYFYPSLNTLSFVDMQVCIESENISKRILCLPLYKELARADVIRISNLINSVF